MEHKDQSDVFLKQEGFTLLEMIAAVGILGAVVLGSANLINQTVVDTKASVTALYMKTVSTAANEYIQSNFATVYTNVTASAVPIVITIETLRTSNHLPAGFSVTNPYGQRSCVIVKSPATNNLVALLATEDGDNVDDVTLGQIAGGIGSAGGAIYAANPNLIRGTMGGWSFAKTEFQNSATKCDGSAGSVALADKRPAVALWFAEGNTINATLYRNAVPSNPALNTMETPIILGTGTQRTDGDACATVGMLARDTAGSVLSCDGTIWKRQSSAFWNDPVLNFAALPAAGDQVGSVRMTLDNSRAFMFTGAAWNPLSVDQNGNMTIPNTLTAANGHVVARDQAGGGGIIELIGSNNVKMHLQSDGGKFRLVNDAWTQEIFSVTQAGDLTSSGRIIGANRKFSAWEQPGEGGVIELTGANNTKMYIENVNGTLRLINDPWNSELVTFDQSGNVNTRGNINANGNMTAQGEMIANGNISSGQTISGGYAKLTVISTVGSACAPEGLISMDNTGKILTCYGNRWTYGVSQLAGEICGIKNSNNQGTDCQGFNPLSGCPDGYSRVSWDDANGSGNMYYCSKI